MQQIQMTADGLKSQYTSSESNTEFNINVMITTDGGDKHTSTKDNCPTDQRLQIYGGPSSFGNHLGNVGSDCYLSFGER